MQPIVPTTWQLRSRTDDAVELTVALEPQPGYPFALDIAVDLITEFARGDNRRQSLSEFGRLFTRTGVGATADWGDPLPSLYFQRTLLRHPGGLVRPYLSSD